MKVLKLGRLSFEIHIKNTYTNYDKYKWKDNDVVQNNGHLKL